MKKLIYKLALLGLFVSLMAGCQSSLDINKSPNAPDISNATPAILFPAGTLGTIGQTGGNLAAIGGIWSEYFTQSVIANQYKDIASYNITTNSFNAVYTGLFSNGLKNFQAVIDKSSASGDWNYYLLGTVMKAYTTQVLVDLYGTLPYSEALQGQANLTPKWDEGSVVYDSLISAIEAAKAKDFSASTNTVPGSEDMIFGGDITKWIEFANTLELKIYLRMVNDNPTKAQAGIVALYNSGATFLTSDAAVTNFTDQQSKDNPFYENNIRSLNTGDNLRASTTFVSWLLDNGDPRIINYFGKASPSSVNQGDDQNTTTNTSAAVFVQAWSDPVEIISAAESYFLQAEARVRFFNGDGAESLYNSGVLAAFNQFELDGSTLLAGKYKFPSTGSDAQIESIITQKWASCAYGCHGIEAFFEKNRTGYPKTSAVYSTSTSYIPGQFVVSKTSVLGGQLLPQRLPVPYISTSNNPNAPTPVAISVPVWWAKK
ncbi:MAG: hypothetical protein DI598_00405 [Pseudopedobacter saltans]|uniref:SusD/RagB family nutrient-binding outer membrane lipoprotein n=1 Tax=Pseudopedobacter saltans TaxID=151895 RepID=A0A2W5FFZ8_9SPHI|nr:MAG: hypothetical protein DI598_00405 [Pseudopedobacter saltans]